LNEDALHAQAHLAAIEEAARIGHFGGRGHVGVLAHDHRITAAKLERDSLDLGSSHLHDVAADLGRASKRDAAYPRMAQQLLAHFGAAAGDDVDGARG
jgi:hypothetical protein